MRSTPSPARIFLAFVLVLLAAMLIAAIASPWIQALLAPLAQFPLHRVFSRLTMLGVLGGTAWLLVRQRLAQRELLGFNRPWPQFLQRLLLGLLAGLALMALALVPLFLLDLRVWSERFPADSGALLALALKGLGSGLLVALIEESFFRGAMQGALQRQGSARWALFAVPVLYSAVHFLGRAASVPFDEVNGWSGFTAWFGFFTLYAEPLRILDAFVALYFVGLLLALVRWRWGDLAGCIGLHAGFVAVIAVFRRISAPAADTGWSFLVGSFDGLLGIWIAALTILACLVVAGSRKPPRGGAGLVCALGCIALFCHAHPARSAGTEGWMDVSGFRVDTSRASKSQVATTLTTLQQQIRTIETAKLSSEILAFFRSVPIVIDPTLTGMNGAYVQMDCKWVVRARAGQWPPERAILLHELLHAYHHQVLKQPTPPIGSAYSEALRKDIYPPEYRDAHFMSNAREFFAVIGEIYLSGPSFRPPFNCANVQRVQPGFIAYLSGLFGERECP